MKGANGQVKWVNFKEIASVLQAVLDKNPRYNPALKVSEVGEYGYWSWARNSPCKYVGIRIDMRDGHAVLCNRDGHAVLCNRDGHAISVEQLEFQAVPNAKYPSNYVVPLEEWAEQDLGPKLCSDIKGHIAEFVESTNDVDDLYRAILTSIRQDLREPPKVYG